MADQIPPEIITEVLLRAEVPTLQNCRLVSKQWRSTIDDPCFIKRHIHYSINSNTNNILFIQEKDGRLHELDFDNFGSLELCDRPSCPRCCSHSLVGSCNGLICIWNEQDEDLLIVNPSLRKRIWMPGFLPAGVQFPWGPIKDGLWMLSSGYGFGYDCVSDDYKIVRLLQFLGFDGFLKSDMLVCCVKTKAVTIVTMPYVLSSAHCMGVLAAGALHWTMRRYDNLNSPNLIVGFDLGTHESQEVPQPDYVNDWFIMDIGLIGTCLCVLANYLGVGIDVWVMKEYGVKESWTKLFNVPPNVLFCESIRPLGFWKMGSEILLELDRERLVWYDTKKRIARNVLITGLQNWKFESIICLRSLVSPDAYGGMDDKLASTTK